MYPCIYVCVVLTSALSGECLKLPLICCMFSCSRRYTSLQAEAGWTTSLGVGAVLRTPTRLRIKRLVACGKDRIGG